MAHGRRIDENLKKKTSEIGCYSIGNTENRGFENSGGIKEEAYSYNNIGNLLVSSVNATTNTYTSNRHNPYTSIQSTSAPSAFSAGELVSSYDSGNRLLPVSFDTGEKNKQNRML